MDFVHLKTKTEFSLSEGINRIDDIVEKAKNNSMGALAITDNNAMFGSLDFYKATRKAGLKPIIGLDVTIEQETGNKYQLTLIAKNDNGYRRLIELNSKSYTERINTKSVSAKEEWLASLEDVIVLSGAKEGLVGQLLLANDYEAAKAVALEMKDYFGEDFYIELQRDASADEEKYMDGAVQICQELNIAPVATHPNYFTEREDFVAHEARYCINSGNELFDLKRARPFNKDMYFKTKEEMSELFSDLPQALENTVALAKKCNITLSLDVPKLPIFPTPDNVPLDDYFANIARKGLEERLQDDFPNVEEREKVRPEYEARLNTEIGIIKKMGFTGYFLIVSDFITWAKEQDIPVGPGRGSGAGSLVAYSMKITDINPLPYNLLFERFLNPDRISMPDFDIDFCKDRRGEVINYVRQKYGEAAVSGIGTFGTMASKSVLKDVGRVLGYPYEVMDGLSKMVVMKPGSHTSLKEFIFGDEEKGIPSDEKFMTRYKNEPDVKKIVDIALKLEGITRGIGLHAAGIVIAPTTLTDFTPLYKPDPEAMAQSQFNMTDVEQAGLVKFDFLGLTTLTIIKEAVDLANARLKEKGQPPLNLRKAPLDDAEVYKNVFMNGNTVGIFQFEGKGMTAVLQKAAPSRLEDLTAITALYRPGPMEIIPAWLNSKNLPEEQRDYPDERLRGVLQETYGFMIYQEQVMQCAQIIAGYSLGGADILRRAMGKKKPEEMAKQREIFIEGAGKNGLSEDKANSLFDLIEKFSGYGFNKSHAAAYSYISFHTAYLKTHFPEEFYAANLNSNLVPTDTDKISFLIEDCKRNNMKISHPDVNKSFFNFTILEDGKLSYGLGALKGVGEQAIQAIVKEREANGEYTDFYNFLERVGKGHVNKRTLDALVKSGAFDALHSNRAQLMEAIAPGLDYVTKFRKSQTDNLSVLGSSLFDDEDSVEVAKPKRKKKVVEVIKPTLQEVTAWDELELAKNEKSVMGFFFTANPFNTHYAKQLDGMKAGVRLSQIKTYNEEGNSEAFVGCIIESIKEWKSKKGAFVTISDGTSTAEVSMFADFLAENKEWLKPDAFAALRVKLQTQYNEKDDSDELRMSVQQGFNFEDTKKLLLGKIFVASNNDEKLIAKFDELSQQYSGDIEDNDPTIILCLPDSNGRYSVQHKKYCVKPDSKLLDELVKTYGQDLVKYSFKTDIDNINFPELAYKGKKQYNNKKKSAFSN